MISSKGPWPSQTLLCLWACPSLRGAGRFLLPKSLACQPKSPKLQPQMPWFPSLRGCIRIGGPSPQILQSKEAAIPTWMAPLCMNMGVTKWIYCCQVKGCPICSHVHWTNLGMKLSCLSCSSTFFNTDTLQWHDKQAHSSGSFMFICYDKKIGILRLRYKSLQKKLPC